MGVEATISADRWPIQSDYLGMPVLVCYHYDSDREFPGVIVRDDLEKPWRCIIRLDDDRYVLSTECQWRPADHHQEPTAP